MTDTKNYCGYVAIVGRPNVGKSTLLNHLLGFKLSITSRKPQTTRHNVLGILTEDDCQIIFVDTPGLHSGQTKALNRYMNRAAGQAIADVDVVVFVVDQVNKVDRVDEKDALLPQLKLIAELLPKADIVPVSALYGKNLDVLRTTIRGYIPEGFYFFPDDQITDKSERFLAAEIVREKITRQLGAEVPYEVTVEIEEWRREEKILHISALILVERDGQKKIIIGEKGARLKKIGQQARVDMEKLFDSKIMLKLWVKVRAGWSDDERALKSLGYHDN